MGTKAIAIVLVVSIGIVSIYSRCTKDVVGCTGNSYAFKVDAKVYPDKDSINIGDTIWAEMNFSSSLLDQTNEIVDFSNANNLGTEMGFVKVVNASPVELKDVVNDFTFKLVFGKELGSPNTQLLKEYSFQELGHKYMFKLAMIPRSSGTYRFNMVKAIDVYRNGNACPKASFYYQLFNTTNQHYYLYPGGAGVTPAGADYYFYVR
ncbi:MAG: hypothetical protein JWR61_869 [Ferruginibacter sp.]|uniref:hypothetical protein n=1 Tax=Ferruginibacter sp. TaxID=1940288 RepID=UPI00265A6150|nr:hypothetical protein [Ferruginibacter sp.]MDB5275914.1 hypothetical protein [Ferruginibacter sp.]